MAPATPISTGTGTIRTLPWIGFCGHSRIKPNELGQPVTEADLLPFVNAQAPVYGQVIEELTAGCKRTHWMWFIFPQLRGLGYSAMAQRYAIRDLDQATRYLADPILGSRLRHDVRLNDRPR